MPDEEKWEKYGFPDGIMFRSPYLPWTGLIKALNERREAVELEPFPVPEYFTSFGGMEWEIRFYDALNVAAKYYVYPDAISNAKQYRDCFWFWNYDDWTEIALDGEDIENVNSFMRPQFSVKWAIFTYNKINLLRYVATTTEADWPTFNYEDRYNSFNFKVRRYNGPLLQHSSAMPRGRI